MRVSQGLKVGMRVSQGLKVGRRVGQGLEDEEKVSAGQSAGGWPPACEDRDPSLVPFIHQSRQKLNISSGAADGCSTNGQT